MTAALTLLCADARARFDGSIRAGLARALLHDRDGVMVGDVLAKIDDAKAGIYGAIDGDRLTGGVVCRRIEQYGRRVLLVWLAWNDRRDLRTADYWPEVQRIARDLRCSRIEAWSPRPWHRLQPALRPAYHVFHHEVVP